MLKITIKYDAIIAIIAIIVEVFKQWCITLPDLPSGAKNRLCVRISLALHLWKAFHSTLKRLELRGG